MRDPKRIDRILSLLKRYWHQHLDLRLGQIVGNAKPGTLLLDGSHRPADAYYLEDDDLERYLRGDKSRCCERVEPEYIPFG